MSQTESVIIVGSGPAGYTAALYAARAALQPLLFTGAQPGGQLTITTDVENYPGFPDGIQGPEMMELFRRQAERFGTQVMVQTVDRIDLSQRPFGVWSDGQEYRAQTLIISTGATAKWLGLDGEVTYQGMGVSACATCDGFFFRGKVVAVVGGGDTAMEEAHYLTHHASKVYLIHRRNEFRASQIMQERVLNNPKIEVIWSTAVDEILGTDAPHRHVTGLRLRDTQTGTIRDLDLNGVFIAIGHQPNSELVKGQLAMDEVGYLQPSPHTSLTEVPGVFVCGDVADSRYRQAVTAAGSGCMAAIDAERFLTEHGPA